MPGKTFTTAPESMDFEPTISAPASPTDLVWSFAFAEGHLLLPDDEETLAPGPSIDGEVRHYLGRLGGLDAWALQLKTVPHGWRMVPLLNAMMDLPAPHGGLAGHAAHRMGSRTSLLRCLRHAYRAPGA